MNKWKIKLKNTSFTRILDNPSSSEEHPLRGDNLQTEKITAQKFVDSLVDHIAVWSTFKSTLELDEAILEFSSTFYNDFSAVHNEAFKSRSKIQQEFLNTDAIYITAYSSLCLAYRGEETLPW
ncbi:hypothetical protein ANCDUO_26904, partial [Ancylostoma duodenale]